MESSDLVKEAMFFLVDNNLEGQTTGIELVRILRKANQEATIVFWTGRDDELLRSSALAAGADSTILKGRRVLVDLENNLP